MGTRNITAVVLDGKYRVAQYGQWDGDPSGQGETVATFIQSADIEKFKKAVSECKFLESQAELDAFRGGLNDDDLRKKHPQFTRNTAAEILQLIQDGERVLQNEIEFCKDSLFCEWAYVVNLDTQKVEVYKGFNKTPLKEGDRFYFPEPDRPYIEKVEGKIGAKSNEYYPVKLYREIPFKTAIKDMEKITEDLNKEAEAEEGEVESSS